MTTLRVVAHLKARPEKIDETREALMSMIEQTRAEEGCIVYELMQNDVIARAEELFASPPDIRRYTLIA
jgi:quinol monooxygenase YgiN